MQEQLQLLVIGGSWGGIKASLALLASLPASFPVPIILVLHRLKNTESELAAVYNHKTKMPVTEIEEKEIALPGHVYLAPANYHVLVESDLTLSLDISPYENFSRPSLDVTFCSASAALGPGVLGILLSGASADGSKGLQTIATNGGMVIVQDPTEAEADTMPNAAIKLLPDCTIMNTTQIADYLCSLI